MIENWMDVSNRYRRNVNIEAEKDGRLMEVEELRRISSYANYALQYIVGLHLMGDSERNVKYFSNVPLSHYEFLTLVGQAKIVCDTLGIKSPNFLDVGCGLGTTLMMAKMLDFTPFGLDRCQKYVEVARMMTSKNQVFHQSATTFKHYGDYDVVYWYNPIEDTKMMSQVENKILEESKTPVVLLSAFENKFLDDKDLKDVLVFRKISGTIMYVKCGMEYRDKVSAAMSRIPNVKV